jgi:hypothetical protein
MSSFIKFIVNLLTATSTRATVRTVWGYLPNAVYTDSPVLLSLAIGEVAITNGRRISEGVWSKVDINGVPFPTTTSLSNEDSATNYLLNSNAPVTQTTASLGTGFYTLSVYGTGSALASGGTATITGAASATEGSPNTIEVTVAGTVTITVTGSLDYFQLEGGSVATSIIITAGTTITRAADINTVPTPSVLTAESGAIELLFTPTRDLQGTNMLLNSFVDGSNQLSVVVRDTRLDFIKTVAGVPFTTLFNYNYSAGTQTRAQVYFDNVLGIGIRVADADADISAVGFITDPDVSLAPINDVLYLGVRGDASLLFETLFDSIIAYQSPQAAGWL